jgi:predicted extracellular nuclease
MRVNPWRGVAAALVATGLLSCADLPTRPRSNPTGTRATLDVTVPSIVISQVYGGGGNSGAPLKNDFIELFNPGTTPVNITGWSVQYASSAGTTWQVTPLTGTIQPGAYYLVQEAAGTATVPLLPTPDASGGIAMSGTSGKVALSQTSAALSGACPTAHDFVSYGTAATACGTMGTTPTLANATAAIRNSAGCAYSGSVSADFTVAAPAPRNSASPIHECPAAPAQPATITVTPAAPSIPVGTTQAFTSTARDLDEHRRSSRDDRCFRRRHRAGHRYEHHPRHGVERHLR